MSEIPIPITFGVDLGGTKVEVALVDGEGNILSSHKLPTRREKGPDGIIGDIVECSRDCLNKTGFDVEAFGIGVAGQVDSNGVVLHGPNLNWLNVPLKDMLEEQIKLPVIVVNDVRAATWGEWQYGSGKGVEDLVVLFVGTGIGGGIVSGGRIVNGSTNTGGELGHMTIVTGGRKCHCRNSGCLEAYAGGWAISERAQHAVIKDHEAGQELMKLAGKVRMITTVTVGQAYHSGDKLATQLIEEAGRFLAAGIVGIVNALNPRLVVMGGGVIEGIPELIHIAQTEVHTKALKAALQDLQFSRAALGGMSGVIGAAGLAKYHLDKTSVHK